MAKKKTNQFNAESEGIKAGAPGDETSPDGFVKGRDVKLKKNGEPFKVRGPSGPRTVNPKIAEFTNRQATDLALFKANQRTAKRDFMRTLRVETEAANLQTRMEKKTQAWTPEEREWFKNLAMKEAALKPIIHADPELEQHP